MVKLAKSVKLAKLVKFSFGKIRKTFWYKLVKFSFGKISKSVSVRLVKFNFGKMGKICKNSVLLILVKSVKFNVIFFYSMFCHKGGKSIFVAKIQLNFFLIL